MGLEEPNASSILPGGGADRFVFLTPAGNGKPVLVAVLVDQRGEFGACCVVSFVAFGVENLPAG